VSAQKHIILCSLILGGAEIFTLERLLQGGADCMILHCNSELALNIFNDKRYSSVKVISEPGLDGLASNFTFTNLICAVISMRPVIEMGGALLGNLRAASMMLHPAVARRNDAFIHDNSHYLNLKARILMAFIIVRSRRTFFPCRHSILRVPFYRLLLSRIVVDYFETFHSFNSIKISKQACLNIAIIGRIEPEKNQKLAMAIVNHLASSGAAINFTLIGSRAHKSYYDEIIAMENNPAVKLTQIEVLRSEIPSLIKKQDLILHTSIAESLPLVLFETNMLKIPFFALPVGGIPEVLPDKYWLNVDVEKSVQKIKNIIYGC
jgi:glycosyltransferase involved in cell wall biosynthesis